MKPIGWRQLLDGWPWFTGAGAYPLAAYSEFMPPPRLGRGPYGSEDPGLFEPDDPWGWYVSEYQEALQLREGMKAVAESVLTAIGHLGAGRPDHRIARSKLEDNPCWPSALAAAAGSLRHERHVLLLPMALSRTQDDKGRLRWTVFGNSELGPARPFWAGFFTAPDKEWPREQSLDFIRRLLALAYEEPPQRLADLGKAGFRILPQQECADPIWSDGELPGWTRPFLLEGEALRGVKYLLTFQPFAMLPAGVQKAYLAGRLHLLPCPFSLYYWGDGHYRTLAQELPLARQVPLMHRLGRHEGPHGLRVPQSGWLHEPRPDLPVPGDYHGPFRNTFIRTHRWGKVLRHEDEIAASGKEDHLTRVLFSTNPEFMGLYGKPMACNVQLWTSDYRLLLDGPNATREDLQRAKAKVKEGGEFGYRFVYPAMRVGRHEVYWHRPLVAFPGAKKEPPVVLADAPLGIFTAYPCAAGPPDVENPVTLWPRLRQRPEYQAALELFVHHVGNFHSYQTCWNIRKLLDTRDLLDAGPLPRSLARRLLTCSKHETLDEFLQHLPRHASDSERGHAFAKELAAAIEPENAPLPEALTYHRTARRSWEVAYWKTIAALAEGKYLNKNNADCVLDEATQKRLTHQHRDLDALGDYILHYYTRLVEKKGMATQVLVGELPFTWETAFTYPWMSGWQANQPDEPRERDLIVVIPGQDRGRAVIMADHYDTAYMLDDYDPKFGGTGARLAAEGADDNHSATAALMLGAPVFLELSQAGKLACDIWLIHLTGEEFPADSEGARHLARALVQGTLEMRTLDGHTRDLSTTRIQGLYVLDMVAHNNEHDHDVFQISPGTGPQSMWLALQAHLAAEVWRAGTEQWNRRSPRKGKGRGRRSPHGGAIPDVFEHLAPEGQVRPTYDPRSTLYNTDGQIFSDAGVPAVLFMENYDINRAGYHDTKDTMAQIDLDYGAAVAAIAIESVARAASVKIKD